MEKDRLLIVDDSPTAIMGLTMFLEDSPHFEIVGEVRDGSEVLEKVNALRPDVVILDFSMPGLSGVDVTRRIKDSFSDIKIVIYTGYAEDADAKELFDAGASAFVLKLYGADGLECALNAIRNGKKYVCPFLDTSFEELNITNRA